MVKLSKRTEYAIRALVHFARLGSGVFVQWRDVAAKERIPTKFLEAVLLGLKRHGYLESKVGSGGGYRLCIAAHQITIGELIRTLEREETTDDISSAISSGETALQILQGRLKQAQSTAMDRLTLEQLVEETLKRLETKTRCTTYKSSNESHDFSIAKSAHYGSTRPRGKFESAGCRHKCFSKKRLTSKLGAVGFEAALNSFTVQKYRGLSRIQPLSYQHYSEFVPALSGSEALPLKEKEAAKLLSISERLLWPMRHDEEIAFVRIGRAGIRYRRDNSIRWVATHSPPVERGPNPN